MNYLAHILLSGADPELRIGNLLGDFVTPAQAAALPPTMLRGVHMHRFIDRYADSHTCVQLSKSRISPLRRRYAGILVDIFYDHFLAARWPTYGSGPLRDFTQHFYQQLEQHYPWLPPRLQTLLPIWRREDWLAGYAEVSGIDQVLQAFSRHRVQRENPLADAVCELRDNYATLEADFQMFWPQLASACTQWQP